MRVLVTGGAGFIGSHLVERFLREGFRVRVLDNLDPKIHPNGRPAYLPANIEFVEGSVTDRAVLYRALRDVDIVSHQAAFQDYMPQFAKFIDVNAVGTALIYELIVQHRLPIRKVIVASSQAVYGEGQYQCEEHGFFLPLPRSQQQLSRAEWEIVCPICGRSAQAMLLNENYTNPFNQYAVSKLAEERVALGLGWLHGIPSVALRYSITQGPRQSLYNHYSGVCRIFFSLALRGQPLCIYEDGSQTRDFVHVLDVVDANMLVLDSDEANFQSFNVGSGTAVSIGEYADKVLKLVGSAHNPKILGEYRRGDNRHSVSSSEKLMQLGWQPQRDLTVIMKDFLQWIDEIGGIPERIPDASADMKGAGVLLSVGVSAG